ncbi:CD48 antigen-like [Trachinotus anak]|uniref:CD48 antigen-like n=1 Tax=Trachinotus anak TaxID=443729 RepID=UPI0039F23160
MDDLMRLFIFFIVLNSCATEKVNLASTVGGNITLPDPVDDGFLSFGPKIIAVLKKREIQILEELYKDRLLWNNNTGLLTLTGLQRNDSGAYALDSSRSYTLTVYDAVPTPAVKQLSVTTESCTLLCVVDKAENTTLLWYKDEEILNQSSSALSLPLTVHKKDYISSYSCEAASPAEKKTLSVNVKTTCTEQTHTDSRNKRHYIIGITIPILSVVIVTLGAFIIKRKCHDKSKRTRQPPGSVSTEGEVEYTPIHVNEGRHSQGGSFPDSSAAVDNSHLTTVYDKLEVHRIVPPHTAEV